MMTLKGLLTTIAIKIEIGEDNFKWIVDTYPRLIPACEDITNESFVKKYEEEYDGNGIVDIKVLETISIGEYTIAEVADGNFKREVKTRNDNNYNVTLDF